MTEVISLFITCKDQQMGNTFYNYQDGVYSEEEEPNNKLIIWNGQRSKTSKDQNVIALDKYIFWRRNPGEHFKYIGIVEHTQVLNHRDVEQTLQLQFKLVCKKSISVAPSNHKGNRRCFKNNCFAVAGIRPLENNFFEGIIMCEKL